MRSEPLILCLLSLLLFPGHAQQHPEIAQTSLETIALDGKALHFVEADLNKLPLQSVSVSNEDGTVSSHNRDSDAGFHNIGLYNMAGDTSYPPPNLGTYDFTHRSEDIGKFKAPSLRNVELRAPQMHGGSIPNLGALLDHYASVGRTIDNGPRTGVGKNNLNKDPRINGFNLTLSDRRALVEFLKTLTDESVSSNAAWANPWHVH